jgi:hypothetical protein
MVKAKHKCITKDRDQICVKVSFRAMSPYGAAFIGEKERRAGPFGGGRIANLISSLNPPVHISLPRLGKVNEIYFSIFSDPRSCHQLVVSRLHDDRAADAGLGVGLARHESI